MYIIIFGVFIIKLQITVSEPQFPPHIDFHKVGEAIFNNEKFNILRPTTHVVTDHFKDFMLRTESRSPEKRVFIDNNGFRHDWSGFGEKTKSLRKTDVKHHVRGSFGNASTNNSQSDIISADGNDNTTATVQNNHQEVKNNASDSNGTALNLTEEDTEIPESKETTTIIHLFPAIQKNNSSSENTIEKSVRQGRGGKNHTNAVKPQNNKAKVQPPPKTAAQNKKAVAEPAPKTAAQNKKAVAGPAPKTAAQNKKAVAGPAPKTAAQNKKAVAEPAPKTAAQNKKAVAEPAPKTTAQNKTAPNPQHKKTDEDKPNVKRERTVAKTTFFCPYLGIITMSAFID